MTKTQQKLARQAAIFLNCGGKAMTAIMRLMFLAVAVLFEAIGLLFSRIDEVMADTLSEAESKRNEAHTFTLEKDKEEIAIVPRHGSFASEPAILNGTVGSSLRRK